MPSTAPLSTISMASPTIRKSLNLMLELPALTTKMARLIGLDLHRLVLHQVVGIENRNGAGSQTGPHVVGAARQDQGDARAEDDPCGIGARHEAEVLRQHVAGLEIGDDQYLRAAGNRRDDPLNSRGIGADRVVEG